MNLRELLIQRAARLQDYPALSVAPWGELSYPAFRNRVEGVALGLMASSLERCHSAQGSAWDWACEAACGCCGLLWEPGAPAPDPEILGGSRFNHEAGRQPYHDREVLDSTLFSASLDQGELLRRLRRLNGQLGWDHSSRIELPLKQLGQPELRAALWSMIYAGGHAVLTQDPEPSWRPDLFRTFWSGT